MLLLNFNIFIYTMLAPSISLAPTLFISFKVKGQWSRNILEVNDQGLRSAVPLYLLLNVLFAKVFDSTIIARAS